MKTHQLLFITAIALAAAITGNLVGAGAAEKETEKESTKMPAVLRHIVYFQFTSEENAREVTDAFIGLKDKIDLIKGFEWGTNVSKEGLDKGFTHAFTLTFHSQADLDAYIVHTAHQAFVAQLDGKVADVCVFDYWTPSLP